MKYESILCCIKKIHATRCILHATGYMYTTNKHNDQPRWKSTLIIIKIYMINMSPRLDCKSVAHAKDLQQSLKNIIPVKHKLYYDRTLIS